eukprot:scaffold347_cov239-Pinguiococcus_pyrenoidosus.AAC.46
MIRTSTLSKTQRPGSGAMRVEEQLRKAPYPSLSMVQSPYALRSWPTMMGVKCRCCVTNTCRSSWSPNQSR